MNRKSLIYSGALLVSLVVVSVLVGTGLVRAIQDRADLSFTTSLDPNELGTERALHGEILFPNEEAVTVGAIELQIIQTSPNSATWVDVYLPVQDHTDLLVDLAQIDSLSFPVADILDDPQDPDPANSSRGTLRITVELDGVVEFETSTLPGSTIPPGAGKFKGITPGAKIKYWIYWTAPAEVPYVGLYDAKLRAHIHAGGQSGDIVSPTTATTFEITLPNVDISIEPEQTVGEADGTVFLTVTADPAPLADVVVSYDTATGTATAGDYTGGTGQVTILANEPSAAVEIGITDDNADEFDETFTVTLTGATGPGIVDAANDTATVTIEDDDVPVLSFVADALSVDEAAGLVRFTVQADIAPKENIVVSWVKTGVTATAGDDYGALTPNVTILANQLTGFRNTNIVNDNADERDETFTGQLTAIVSGEATIGSPSTQTVTIEDDDGHPTILTPGDTEIVEGTGGTTTLELTLGLSAPSDFDITVTVGAGAAGDTAEIGVDYLFPFDPGAGATDTVTFTGGSVEETLSIGIVADADDEFNETFKILWGSSGAQTDGDGDPPISNAETIVTIIDDDIPQLSVQASTVGEADGSYSVTVVSDIGPKQDLSLPVRVFSRDQVDVATIDVRVKIEAGQTSGTGTVNDGDEAADVVIDDQLDEIDETFAINILNGGVVDPATKQNLVDGVDFVFARKKNQLTVVDDDATPTLQPEASKTVAIEGDEGGETIVEIAVTLRDPDTGSPTVSGLPVQFDYETTDGTATNGQDYVSKSDTAIIPAGAGSTVIRVKTKGDVDVEHPDPESFFVDYSAGDSASGSVLISPNQTEIKIFDDDLSIVLSILDNTVPESGDPLLPLGQPHAVLRVKTDSPVKSGQTLSFVYEIASGTATAGDDFRGTKIGKGQIGGGSDTGIIAFPIVDDSRYENDETVNVSITEVIGGTIGDGGAVLTIVDNELVPDVVLLALPAGGELFEGESNEGLTGTVKAFGVKAAISSASLTTASDFPIAVTYNVIPVTALLDQDYEVGDGVSTIPPGATESQAVDLIKVIDDTAIENDETLMIFGLTATSNGENGGFGPNEVIDNIPAGRSQTLTIKDNDSGFVLAISGPQTPVTEGAGTATLTVKSDRVNDDTKSVTVDVVTAGGSAVDGSDYQGGTFVATILVGESTGTVDIPIIDDAINELPIEDFTATLSNASPNGVIYQQKAAVTVQVRDDDDPPIHRLLDKVIEVVEGDPSGSLAGGETTEALVRVEIIGVSALTTTVPYLTGDGTEGFIARAKDGDFSHVQRGNVDVPPGTTEVVVPISIFKDFEYEGNESFTVFFPQADGRKRVLGFIYNDDAPTPVDDLYDFAGAGYDEGKSFSAISNKLRSWPEPGILDNDPQLPDDVKGAYYLGAQTQQPFNADFETHLSRFLFKGFGLAAGSFYYRSNKNVPEEGKDVTFDYVAVVPASISPFTSQEMVPELTSEPATVTIKLADVPPPPPNPKLPFVRGGGQAQFLFGVAAEQGALANVPDAQNKVAVLVDDIPPEHGVLDLQPDGSFTYNTIGTEGDYFGNTFFTFRVEDAAPAGQVFGDQDLLAFLICQNPCLDVEIPSLTVDETQGTFTFDVVLTNGVHSNHSIVDVDVQGGGATRDSDFTFTTASFSDDSTEPRVTYTVNLTDDTGSPIFEGSETFDIVLSGATGVGVGASTDIPLAEGANEYRVTITMLDDEDAVTVDVGADVSLIEDAGSASVGVTVTGAHSVDVEVDYSTLSPNTNDAATAGADYTATSGKLTFVANPAGGSVTQTLDILITDDTNGEINEQLLLELTNPVNALIGDGLATIAIDDNEQAQSDQFTMMEDDQLVVDAAGGVLSNDVVPAGETPTINLVTDLQSGTGVLNLNLADGSFTYTPPTDFTGDATFQYEFSTTDPTAAAINSNVADVTISVSNLNDEPVATADGYDVTPGQALNVDAQSGVLANDADVDNDPSELTAQIVQNPAHGTLIANSDGSFDYTPAALTSTNFTYVAVDPLSGESVETVVGLNLPPSFDISLSLTAVDEDTDLQVIATIDLFNADPNAISEVTFSTVSGTATVLEDLAELSQVVALTEAVPQQQIIISIFNDAGNSIREGLETFGVRLDNAVNSVILGETGGQRTEIVTIDDPADTPTLSISDLTVTEGTGTLAQALIEVTQAGKTAIAASVDYATGAVGDSATADVDYASQSGTVNFGPNTAEHTQTQNITVDITDDSHLENDETFTITLSNAQNSTIDDGDATVTIDDDEQLPQADDDEYGTNEDNQLVVDVSSGVLVNDTSTPVGLPLTSVLVADVSDGTLAFNTDGSFTYTPDPNFHGVVTFTYEALQDGFVSNEAMVTISVNSINDLPLANDDFFFVDPNGGEVTFAAPGILANDVDVEDGGPGLTVVNVVKAIGDPSQTLTVGTYGVVTYNPNGNATVTTFTYQARDSDGAETSPATVRLGQIPSFSLAVSPTTIDEGAGGSANVSVTITLNNAQAGTDSTVQLVTTGDGGVIGSATDGVDYEDVDQIVTLNTDNTSQTVQIAVLNDGVREGDEVFQVSIKNPDVNSAIVGAIGGAATVDVTITDEEDIPVLSIGDQTVNEDAGTVDVTVTLTGQTVFGATVDYHTADGSAIAGQDYDGANGTLTFPANTTQPSITGTITVNIIDDGVQELDETFEVNLSNVTRATMVDGNATVTVVDNDIAQITVSDAQVEEGIAGGVASVTISLNIAPVIPVTVSVRTITIGDTATSGVDFTALPTQTVTIPVGATSQTVDIAILDDTLDEIDETFSVLISNAQGLANIADSTATVTIVDDDPTPELSIDATATVDPEGEIGETTSFGLTITLSAASSQNVSVTVDTQNGTATGGADFTPIIGQLVNIPAGDTTATVIIDVLGDDDGEADETFNVVMSGPTNANLAAGQDTTVVTIVDDDGEITAVVELLTGFNLVGLPVDQVITSREIAVAVLPAETAIGQGPVISVLGWDAASQSFKAWAAAAPDANIFTVSPGQGIFVRVSQNTTLTVVGMPITVPIPLDLLSGFNLVSVPAVTAGELTSKSIAEALLPQGTAIGDGPVISVLGWDAASQSFKAWAAAASEANIFTIDSDPIGGVGGYFVRLKEPKQLSP